jgi:hypothetical protein
MISKIRTISLGLFFLFYSFILWASDLDIPLPKDAVKISEKSANFGPIRSFSEIYKTSLSGSRVLSFYKKEMANAGWKEKERGVFVKNKFIAVIICDDLKNKSGKTEFNVIVSNIPAKEELLGMRKTEPDKLSYMPIYPGSVQIGILNLPGGTASAYETESSIEEVVFFYKSAMLNYGWSLDRETQSQGQGGMANCPGCEKSLSGFGNTASKISTSAQKTGLIFNRLNGAETCIIEISNISVGFKGEDLDNKKLGSTTSIFAKYYAHKNIKP